MAKDDSGEKKVIKKKKKVVEEDVKAAEVTLDRSAVVSSPEDLTQDFEALKQEEEKKKQESPKSKTETKEERKEEARKEEKFVKKSESSEDEDVIEKAEVEVTVEEEAQVIKGKIDEKDKEAKSEQFSYIQDETIPGYSETEQTISDEEEIHEETGEDRVLLSCYDVGDVRVPDIPGSFDSIHGVKELKSGATFATAQEPYYPVVISAPLAEEEHVSSATSITEYDKLSSFATEDQSYIAPTQQTEANNQLAKSALAKDYLHSAGTISPTSSLEDDKCFKSPSSDEPAVPEMDTTGREEEEEEEEEDETPNVDIPLGKLQEGYELKTKQEQEAKQALTPKSMEEEGFPPKTEKDIEKQDLFAAKIEKTDEFSFRLDKDKTSPPSKPFKPEISTFDQTKKGDSFQPKPKEESFTSKLDKDETKSGAAQKDEQSPTKLEKDVFKPASPPKLEELTKSKDQVSKVDHFSPIQAKKDLSKPVSPQTYEAEQGFTKKVDDFAEKEEKQDISKPASPPVKVEPSFPTKLDDFKPKQEDVAKPASTSKFGLEQTFPQKADDLKPEKVDTAKPASFPKHETEQSFSPKKDDFKPRPEKEDILKPGSPPDQVQPSFPQSIDNFSLKQVKEDIAKPLSPKPDDNTAKVEKEEICKPVELSLQTKIDNLSTKQEQEDSAKPPSPPKHEDVATFSNKLDDFKPKDDLSEPASLKFDTEFPSKPQQEVGFHPGSPPRTGAQPKSPISPPVSGLDFRRDSDDSTVKLTSPTDDKPLSKFELEKGEKSVTISDNKSYIGTFEASGESGSEEEEESEIYGKKELQPTVKAKLMEAKEGCFLDDDFGGAGKKEKAGKYSDEEEEKNNDFVESESKKDEEKSVRFGAGDFPEKEKKTEIYIRQDTPYVHGKTFSYGDSFRDESDEKCDAKKEDNKDFDEVRVRNFPSVADRPELFATSLSSGKTERFQQSLEVDLRKLTAKDEEDYDDVETESEEEEGEETEEESEEEDVEKGAKETSEKETKSESKSGSGSSSKSSSPTLFDANRPEFILSFAGYGYNSQGKVESHAKDDSNKEKDEKIAEIRVTGKNEASPMQEKSKTTVSPVTDKTKNDSQEKSALEMSSKSGISTTFEKDKQETQFKDSLPENSTKDDKDVSLGAASKPSSSGFEFLDKSDKKSEPETTGSGGFSSTFGYSYKETTDMEEDSVAKPSEFDRSSEKDLTKPPETSKQFGSDKDVKKNEEAGLKEAEKVGDFDKYVAEAKDLGFSQDKKDMQTKPDSCEKSSVSSSFPTSSLPFEFDKKTQEKEDIEVEFEKQKTPEILSKTTADSSFQYPTTAAYSSSSAYSYSSSTSGSLSMTTSRQFAEDLETPASESPTSERVKDDYLEVLEEKSLTQTTPQAGKEMQQAKSECFYKPGKTAEEFGLYTSESSKDKFGMPSLEAGGFGATPKGNIGDFGLYTADVSQEKYGGFPKYASKESQKEKESTKEQFGEIGKDIGAACSKESLQEKSGISYTEIKRDGFVEISKEKEAASAALFGITSSPRPDTEGKHYFEETDTSEEEEDGEDTYMRDIIQKTSPGAVKELTTVSSEKVEKTAEVTKAEPKEEMFKPPTAVYEWEIKSKSGMMVPGDSPPHYRQEFEEEVETEPEHPARPLSLSKTEQYVVVPGKVSPPSYSSTDKAAPPSYSDKPSYFSPEFKADMSLSFGEKRDQSKDDSDDEESKLGAASSKKSPGYSAKHDLSPSFINPSMRQFVSDEEEEEEEEEGQSSVKSPQERGCLLANEDTPPTSEESGNSDSNADSEDEQYMSVEKARSYDPPPVSRSDLSPRSPHPDVCMVDPEVCPPTPDAKKSGGDEDKPKVLKKKKLTKGSGKSSSSPARRKKSPMPRSGTSTKKKDLEKSSRASRTSDREDDMSRASSILNKNKTSSQKSVSAPSLGSGPGSGFPVYVDLAYIPNHCSAKNVDQEFFRRVRASYYVVSGNDSASGEPSRAVLDALLEAKANWGSNLQVTLIPTHDTDVTRDWYQQTHQVQTDLNVMVLASSSTVVMQDESFPACKIEF